MTRLRTDRGSVTLFVAAAIVIAVLLATALAHFGGVVVEKSRAENAADAAALAAAGSLALGQSPAEACAVAASVATDNGARLATCQCPGAYATVARVTVAIGMVRAGARATVDPSASDRASALAP
jgi:secretion/DNA translocation related TadE-like protein